jgi:WD40 repeat protein
MLVLIEAGKGVQLIDPGTGIATRSLEGDKEDRVVEHSLAGDGKRIAIRYRTGDGEDAVIIWDIQEGKKILKLASREKEEVVLTPDGTALVLVERTGSARLVSATTGRDLRALQTGAAETVTLAESRRIDLPRMLPGGRVLFRRDGLGPVITSLETGKIVGRLDGDFPFEATSALSPDGNFLAMVSGEEIRICSLRSGKEVTRLPSSTTITQLVYSPDGRRLAAVDSCGVRLWDIATGQQMHPMTGHTASVTDVAFLPDGRRLVGSAAGEMLLWDIATGRVVQEHRAPQLRTTGLMPIPGGREIHVISGLGAYFTWSLEGGGELVQLGSWPLMPRSPWAISADGRWFAMLPDVAGKCQLFRVAERDRTGWIPPSGQGFPGLMRFAPDGCKVLLALDEKPLRIWSSRSGRELPGGAQTGSRDWRHQALAWSPDSRCLLATDKGVHLIEVFSGRTRREFTAKTDDETLLAFSPDGRLIAWADGEETIVVAAVDSGAEVARWQPDHGTVRCLAFSPDSRLLASGGYNGTILLWQVPKRPGGAATLPQPKREELWQQLAAADAGDAAAALAAFVDAPDASVDWIGAKLRGAWVRPEREHLAKLVADLDAEAFEVRQKAARELATAGNAAEDFLRQALKKSPSPEKVRQVRRLLARLDPSAITAERLQAVRAIEVLERIGTRQARGVLVELQRLTGDPVVVEEIEESIQRLQIVTTEAKKEGRLIP